VDRPEVIVLTQELDPTSDVLINKFRDRGVPIARFDTASFPQELRLVATYASDGSIVGDLGDSRRQVDLSRLKSVWYRRPTTFEFSPGMSAGAMVFARQEARAGLGGALRAAAKLWVNYPEMNARASWKPVQLSCAARHGLRIPRTLLTNDPDEARAFHEKLAGKVIYKTLSGGFFVRADHTTRVIYTAMIDDFAEIDWSSVAHTACLFQEALEKSYELRITVIGTDVFPVKVEAPEGSGIDWRMEAEHAAWTFVDLPDRIHDAVLRIMSELGLSYGAFDMIVDPDGEYYFLEINPMGQFAWMESITGGRMYDALMRTLLLE
jgi:ATP-grasp ribosomal peptide maturase